MPECSTCEGTGRVDLEPGAWAAGFDHDQDGQQVCPDCTPRPLTVTDVERLVLDLRDRANPDGSDVAVAYRNALRDVLRALSHLSSGQSEADDTASATSDYVGQLLELRTQALARVVAERDELRAVVERVRKLVTSDEVLRYRDEAARGLVQLPYASNRYLRLVDALRALLPDIPNDERSTT